MGNNKKILIMAGGTGGHIFPALAIASALKNAGFDILWLGTRGRMEEKLVPQYGYPIRYIDVRGIRRNGLWAKLSAPFMVAGALRGALAVLKEFKPDVVLGMGGYASGPGGLAAWLKHIPLVLHEQNAAAGLTNRILSRFASAVMLGFPGAFSGPKVTVTGNPLREVIIALHGRPRDFSKSVIRIFILGGSLGARALNETVPAALLKAGDGFEVIHQCGAGNHEAVEKLYAGASFKVTVSDFIDDMAGTYSKADLIICRAGASTVAEVACAGLPAIFVPLPSAVDDHQTKNALFLKEAGAAEIMPQAQLTPETLAAKVQQLFSSRDKLAEMSQQATLHALVNATDRAVKIIESFIKK